MKNNILILFIVALSLPSCRSSRADVIPATETKPAETAPKKETVDQQLTRLNSLVAALVANQDARVKYATCSSKCAELKWPIQECYNDEHEFDEGLGGDDFDCGNPVVWNDYKTGEKKSTINPATIKNCYSECEKIRPSDVEKLGE
jgi:hypothetical protein